MLEMENDTLCLRIAADASSVQIVDRRRSCEWRLDPTYSYGGRHASEPGDPQMPVRCAARKAGAEQIVVSCEVAPGTISYDWRLHDDHVQVSVESSAQDLEHLPLPSPFVPASGTREIAIPLYQGLLLRASGKTWERSAVHGGHANFSMAMAAAIAEKGALLATHDCPTNWTATYGEDRDGPLVFFEHQRCPVDGWTGATVRLYPTDRSVTAICKQYRHVVQQRGDFVPWQAKIAAKPMVKELFGALLAFVGYNETAEIDYPASAAKLAAYSFASVLYYPVRMCHYSLDFEMGGDDPIWLPDGEIEALRAVDGTHLSPWAWVFEGLDDGSQAMRQIFRQGKAGPVPGWRMDGNQWHSVCTPYQVEHIKRRLATDMRAMDWIHFDVSANIPGRPCLSREHALHGNQPLSSRSDMAWTRTLLSAETVGNRIVSSEGFCDYHTPAYDVGSTKLLPLEGSSCTPIPMTMLVFHDSCVHDWWELHNYNANVGFPLQELPDGLGRVGSGEPQLKAAMDALYGCPPNLFPFGRQYGWVDAARGQTYSFLVRLEDPSVQEAIRAALPVARLHAKIGMCEMASLAFLSDDRLVQATTFSDGTRVTANLSNEPRHVHDLGLLPAHSWRESPP
jgi:hypothetical protein